MTLAARGKYSTQTLMVGGVLTPWLAAQGPLAYSVEQPPERDYFFQYGWVLPGVLNPDRNLRQHYYFGAYRKDDAHELFAFWNAARAGSLTRMFVRDGRVEPTRVSAPLAAYEWHSRRGPAFMLIQHGSYLCVNAEDQPELRSGVVYLYRGIQRAQVFRWARPVEADAVLNLLPLFLGVQAKVLSDSVLSFNSVHDRVRRSETGHIQDGTWVTDRIATEMGLPIKGEAAELWSVAHQCYSLSLHMAERKFGPNYVVCKTPTDNIRLTTFFAGEDEVRVIDPRRVELVETVGCRLAG